MNWDEWTTADLEQAYENIDGELSRRRLLDSAPEQAEALARSVLTAQGVEEGEEWQQPTSTVDAYPYGWTVTHQGGVWTSMVRGANMWEPGSEGGGWRLEDDPDGTPAQWVRPSSTEDAYRLGDRVTFEGQVWESVWANPNTWSPAEFADAWQLVSGSDQPDPDPDPDPEPDPEPDPDPEPEPEPDVPVWQEPTWAGEAGGAYQLGDRVRYPDENGPVFESTHDGWNTWSPAEYPDAWKLIDQGDES